MAGPCRKTAPHCRKKRLGGGGSKIPNKAVSRPSHPLINTNCCGPEPTLPNSLFLFPVRSCTPQWRWGKLFAHYLICSCMSSMVILIKMKTCAIVCFQPHAKVKFDSCIIGACTGWKANPVWRDEFECKRFVLDKHFSGSHSWRTEDSQMCRNIADGSGPLPMFFVASNKTKTFLFDVQFYFLERSFLDCVDCV